MKKPKLRERNFWKNVNRALTSVGHALAGLFHLVLDALQLVGDQGELLGALVDARRAHLVRVLALGQLVLIAAQRLHRLVQLLVDVLFARGDLLQRARYLVVQLLQVALRVRQRLVYRALIAVHLLDVRAPVLRKLL